MLRFLGTWCNTTRRRLAGVINGESKDWLDNRPNNRRERFCGRCYSSGLRFMHNLHLKWLIRQLVKTPFVLSNHEQAERIGSNSMSVLTLSYLSPKNFVRYSIVESQRFPPPTPQVGMYLFFYSQIIHLWEVAITCIFVWMMNDCEVWKGSLKKPADNYPQT